MVGTIKRIALKTALPYEAHDFTPWLAQNLDVLGDKMDLDLEHVGNEFPVGPYRADIVAKVISNTGSEDDGEERFVVIENQYGASDHPHLGQLLVYAAGLDARYAVWVAESFTDEHRSALQRLNRTSVDGIGYFAIEAQAIVIGNSEPAVQLMTVVEPDQWAKHVQAEAAASLSPRSARYQSWWSDLLAELGKVQLDWSAISARKDSWVAISAGRPRVQWIFSFTQLKGFRCELYVDGLDTEDQSQRWKQLTDERDLIDQALPGLSWEELPERRASRVCMYFPGDAPIDIMTTDAAILEDVAAWAVGVSPKFRSVLGPHVLGLT